MKLVVKYNSLKYAENDKSSSEQGIIDLTDSPDFREKSVVDDDHLDEPIGFAHDKRKRIFNFKYNFENFKIQRDFILYLFLISILKEASEKYFYEKKIFQIETASKTTTAFQTYKPMNIFLVKINTFYLKNPFCYRSKRTLWIYRCW